MSDEFEVTPGEPVPVSLLRKLGKMARQGQSLMVADSPARIVQTPRGQRVDVDIPQEWIVKITAVDASTPKRYGFKEVYQDVTTGAYADHPSGLIVDGVGVYALAPEGVTHAVNDVVRVKVHHADGNLFEIKTPKAQGATATSATLYTTSNERLISTPFSGPDARLQFYDNNEVCDYLEIPGGVAAAYLIYAHVNVTFGSTTPVGGSTVRIGFFTHNPGPLPGMGNVTHLESYDDFGGVAGVKMNTTMLYRLYQTANTGARRVSVYRASTGTGINVIMYNMYAIGPLGLVDAAAAGGATPA